MAAAAQTDTSLEPSRRPNTCYPDSEADGNLSSDDDDHETEQDIVDLGEYAYLVELGECVNAFIELGPIVRRAMSMGTNNRIPRSESHRVTLLQPEATAQVAVQGSPNKTTVQSQLDDYWTLRFRELRQQGRLSHARDGANLAFMRKHEQDVRRERLPLRNLSGQATFQESTLAQWLANLGVIESAATASTLPSTISETLDVYPYETQVGKAFADHMARVATGQPTMREAYPTPPLPLQSEQVPSAWKGVSLGSRALRSLQKSYKVADTVSPQPNSENTEVRSSPLRRMVALSSDKRY